MCTYEAICDVLCSKRHRLAEVSSVESWIWLSSSSSGTVIQKGCRTAANSLGSLSRLLRLTLPG